MAYKCVVGDVVSFKYDKYVGIGLVRFVGSLLPNKNGLWVGIEREITKSRESKEFIDSKEKPEGYNGKLNDMKYFTVRKDRGIFVPYDCVQSLSKQTELQQMVRSNTKEDECALSNQQQKPSNIQQQLQRTEQLLEASLLLLQNCSLYGQSADKSQLLSHCDKSWKFLNRKYPPSASLILHQNHDIKGGDDEKFVVETKRMMIDNGIEAKKLILCDFMGRYSTVSNWTKAGKETYGDRVKGYILILDTHRAIEVRMSFLYSMMLYLMHCTGCNKRCIAHGAILLMPVKQQISTLAKEFGMVLETLQHNDNDGLWEHVYTFISNMFIDFQHIKPYSGKRIVVDNSDDGNSESEFEEL